MRCTVNTAALPALRTVVQFVFTELPARHRSWWLIHEAGEVDLCPIDPGDVAALEIRTTLRSMTRVWMGVVTLAAAQRRGELYIAGPADLKRRVGGWLRLSPYAAIAAAAAPPPRPARSGSRPA